nr:Flp family type IVb pilin [Iodidimonas nitroreducens]
MLKDQAFSCPWAKFCFFAGWCDPSSPKAFQIFIKNRLSFDLNSAFFSLVKCHSSFNFISIFSQHAPVIGPRNQMGAHSMFKLLRALRKNEKGATAIEYGLIAALVAVAAIGAMTALGGSLTDIFSRASNELGTASTAATNAPTNPE